MDFAEERALVQCTTARADIWAARWGNHPRVPIYRVLGHIISISGTGFKDMFSHYYRMAAARLRPSVKTKEST